VSFDDFEEKATLGFGEAGWQIPLGPAQVCPIVGGSYAMGPNDDLTGLEVSSWSVVGGAALGYPLGSAGPVQLIPNVALRIERFSQTAEEPGFPAFKSTTNSGILDLGLALVLADRLSVQPLVHVLLNPEEGVTPADDEERMSFGVFVSLGLP
jgi:hypothetical protein